MRGDRNKHDLLLDHRYYGIVSMVRYSFALATSMHSTKRVRSSNTFTW